MYLHFSHIVFFVYINIFNWILIIIDESSGQTSVSCSHWFNYVRYLHCAQWFFDERMNRKQQDNWLRSKIIFDETSDILTSFGECLYGWGERDMSPFLPKSGSTTKQMDFHVFEFGRDSSACRDFTLLMFSRNFICSFFPVLSSIHGISQMEY